MRWHWTRPPASWIREPSLGTVPIVTPPPLGPSNLAVARYLLLAALFAPACHKTDPPKELAAAKQTAPASDAQTDADAKPWPAGSLASERIAIKFAVYAMPDGIQDVVSAAKTLHSERYSQIPLLATAAETNRAGLRIEAPSLERFAPPTPRLLQYTGRGLSDEQIAAVQESAAVVSLEFTLDMTPGASVHADAIAMALDLGERTHGLIWDEGTRELFTTEAWRNRRVANPPAPETVTNHFTQHAYRDDDLMRVVTLGLGKFGIPEIAFAHVPITMSDQAMTLVNLVATELTRTGTLDNAGTILVPADSGGGATVEVRLAIGTPAEGDNPGPLIQIVFPGPKSTLHQRQAELLQKVAPIDSDIIDRPADDAELLAASAAAKKELLQLKPKFSQGVPDLEKLTVKAPFTFGDDTEWMWVEVVSWRGHTIAGILQNTPRDIPNLKMGAKVEVTEDAVFDYYYTDKKGVEHGNETSRILERANELKTRRGAEKSP